MTDIEILLQMFQKQAQLDILKEELEELANEIGLIDGWYNRIPPASRLLSIMHTLDKKGIEYEHLRPKRVFKESIPAFTLGCGR